MLWKAFRRALATVQSSEAPFARGWPGGGGGMRAGDGAVVRRVGGVGRAAGARAKHGTCCRAHTHAPTARTACTYGMHLWNAGARLAACAASAHGVGKKLGFCWLVFSALPKVWLALDSPLGSASRALPLDMRGSA